MKDDACFKSDKFMSTQKNKKKYGTLRWLQRHLIRTSVESLMTFGLKSDMPQRQIMAVYAGYSLIGTLFLLFPFASIGDVSFVDHLFTVVSALSTTGLSTVDVATQYTFFGQFVILALIQMGGLGYMTLSSYIMLRLTGRFGTEKAKLFQTQFSFPDTLDSESMLRSIVKYTFWFEIIGFFLLCPYFLWTGVEQPVWSAIFHTISAFCTAGFSIYTDNLIQFQTDVYVNIVIMILSVAGAMGFIMMTDISKKITDRKHRISFTSKVIIVITGVLALWGTLHLFFCEDSFQKMSVGDRLLASLFQSISAMTTVGYNTVDVSQMVPISLLILTVTMYIGASPSGTGGGLKSTTVSALYAYTKNILGLRKNISLCGNVIPQYRITSALTTTIFYSFILFVGIYLIGLFEPNDADFLKIAFEASSALATAGLSSGILADITLESKVVLILLMYIGRVGVITFGNVLLARKGDQSIKGEKDMAV